MSRVDRVPDAHRLCNSGYIALHEYTEGAVETDFRERKGGRRVAKGERGAVVVIDGRRCVLWEVTWPNRTWADNTRTLPFIPYRLRCEEPTAMRTTVP